ncbi:MAG TPA: aminotransferase class III-fold pyridoxal phosphate-dependent enzyme [Solirubrobacteraceae bacterium]|nr:aminotransferase class III-fold pyridoxal phosphate-dependent enzyme [Solirubrobacteraceae bacterium]
MLDRHAEAAALWDAHVNPQFVRVLRTLGFDRTWVRGEGAYLIDDRGGRWLDLQSGFGTFALGRNHPEVKRALHEAIDADTPSLPAMGLSWLPGVLAEQLVARAPAHLDAVVFANSGAESVEAAIKLARAATGRTRVLYATKAFHGLTTGALALNGGAEFRERFGPLLPGADAVPFGDLDALGAALRAGDVAAFLVEPIQGKGVNLPPDGYLAGAQALCHEHGALLALDEVQTGLGRTGRFLALEHWGVEPDLVTLAKALSGGFVPIGAVLTTRRVRDAVFDSMERAVVHGSTFSGGDLAAAAGLATLRVLDDEGLVERAARMGELLAELTRPLAERHEIVREVRGKGLLWALELGPPEGAAARRLWAAVERRQQGLLAQLVTVPLFHEHRMLIQVAAHHSSVVKALPPLTIEEADVHRFARALDDVLGRASRHLLSRTGRLVGGLGARALAAR